MTLQSQHQTMSRLWKATVVNPTKSLKKPFKYLKTISRQISTSDSNTRLFWSLFHLFICSPFNCSDEGLAEARFQSRSYRRKFLWTRLCDLNISLGLVQILDRNMSYEKQTEIMHELRAKTSSWSIRRGFCNYYLRAPEDNSLEWHSDIVNVSTRRN